MEKNERSMVIEKWEEIKGPWTNKKGNIKGPGTKKNCKKSRVSGRIKMAKKSNVCG